MSDQQYDNELRGTLFRNDRRETDTHPEYTGSCQIDGKEYYINAWVNESKKDGKKYFSFRFKPKNAPAQNAVTVTDDDDSDLPF